MSGQQNEDEASRAAADKYDEAAERLEESGNVKPAARDADEVLDPDPQQRPNVEEAERAESTGAPG